MSAERSLKQKIKSVGSLQKITKAMEMIARAKMKRMIGEALASRAYATLALEILESVSAEKDYHNLYLEAPKGAHTTLVLFIASDRGLCGPYNAEIRRKATDYFKNYFRHKNPSRFEFVTVGRNAYKEALRLGVRVSKSFEHLSGSTFHELRSVADLIIEKYKTAKYNRVLIVYSNFISIFKREVIIKNLLPLSTKSIEESIEEVGGTEESIALPSLEHKQEFKSYLYEPSPEAVLDTVIPELSATLIFQAILEARASEESARMVAMKTASDNSEKLGRELEMIYNRARQAEITKEIIEITASI